MVVFKVIEKFTYLMSQNDEAKAFFLGFFLSDLYFFLFLNLSSFFFSIFYFFFYIKCFTRYVYRRVSPNIYMLFSPNTCMYIFENMFVWILPKSDFESVYLGICAYTYRHIYVYILYKLYIYICIYIVRIYIFM